MIFYQLSHEFSFVLLRASQCTRLYFNCLLSNCAFTATIIVLKLIKTAPIAGSRTNPVEYKTPAAKGIAIALYPVAQIRFCTIFLYVAFPKRIKFKLSFGLLFTQI